MKTGGFCKKTYTGYVLGCDTAKCEKNTPPKKEEDPWADRLSRQQIRDWRAAPAEELQGEELQAAPGEQLLLLAELLARGRSRRGRLELHLGFFRAFKVPSLGSQGISL